jgi:hypothetical protein
MRAQTGDPRKPLDARYGDRDAYCVRVESVARELAGQRFLLEEDVERSVAAAGRLWDRIAAG